MEARDNNYSCLRENREFLIMLKNQLEEDKLLQQYYTFIEPKEAQKILTKSNDIEF